MPPIVRTAGVPFPAGIARRSNRFVGGAFGPDEARRLLASDSDSLPVPEAGRDDVHKSRGGGRVLSGQDRDAMIL
jgi:hypothetical protein